MLRVTKLCPQFGHVHNGRSSIAGMITARGGFAYARSMLASEGETWGGKAKMDASLDTFRPSTLGWLRGTLAGWGALLLAGAGILATLMGYGILWIGPRGPRARLPMSKRLQNSVRKHTK